MSKKLYYAPAVAVRYIGADGKDFAASLARPKPVLNNGDIIITDKRTAYNLINKGFSQYEPVESIEIPDADELIAECEHLKSENERLKSELAKALEFLSDDETVNPDETPKVDETVNPDETPKVDETVNPDETPKVDETVNPDETTVNPDETPKVDETEQPKIPRGKNHTSKNKS